MEEKIGQARIAPDYNCLFCYDTGILTGTAELDENKIVIGKVCTKCNKAFREYVNTIFSNEEIDYLNTIYHEKNFNKLFARMVDISIALNGIVEIIGEDAPAWKLHRKNSEDMIKLSKLITNCLNSYVKREEFLENEEEEDREGE